jgi:phosphate-selective porin OprO and OprP
MISIRKVVFSLLLLPAVAAAQEPPPPVEVTPPPPPPPAAPAGTPLVAKFDKGFSLSTADDQFELRLSLKGQIRFESLHLDDRTVGTTTTEANWQSRFLIPRMRVYFDGHIFGKQPTFSVELETANRGFTMVKNAFLNYAFSPMVQLRAGNYKKPFSRQQLVSDFTEEFIERSITDGFIGAGRDLGVEVHNGIEGSPEGIEYALGIFNGPGTETPTISCKAGAMATDPPTCALPSSVPADFGPMLVAHLGFNYGHIKGYSEADLEGGPLRLAVGASYKVNLQDLKKVNGDSQFLQALVLDAMLKIEGFDLSGAFFWRKDATADAQLGLYVQAGYLVVPKRVGVAVRFSQIPAPTNVDEHLREILGALDLYANGHGLKLMIDGGVLQNTDPAVDTTDLQLRAHIVLNI